MMTKQHNILLTIMGNVASNFNVLTLSQSLSLIYGAISCNHRFSSIFIDFRRFSAKFVKIDKNDRSNNFKKYATRDIIKIIDHHHPCNSATSPDNWSPCSNSHNTTNFPTIPSLDHFHAQIHRFSSIFIDFRRFSSIFVKISFLQDCCSKNENGTQKSAWQTSMASLSFRTLSKCWWRCLLFFARKNQVYAIVFSIIDFQNRWKSTKIDENRWSKFWNHDLSRKVIVVAIVHDSCQPASSLEV